MGSQLKAATEVQGLVRNLRPPAKPPRYQWLRVDAEDWIEAVVFYSMNQVQEGDFEVILYLVARDHRVRKKNIGTDALGHVVNSVEDLAFERGAVRQILFRAAVRQGNEPSEQMFAQNHWGCQGPMKKQPEYQEWVLATEYD